MISGDNDKCPLVSVIVPVFKVEKYLAECVRSIRLQTLADIEIILVDDGSPDSCPSICDAIAAEDFRVRVIHKPNEGLGLARNSGLEIARGKWVMFVDSDDFLALNALEYLVGLGENGENIDQVRFLSSNVDCDSDFFPGNADIEGSKVVLHDLSDKLAPMLGAMAPLPAGVECKAVSLASAWSAIYRRDVMVSHGVRFPSEREFISEDYVFNIDFAAVSGGIVFTPERFYYYRVSPKSLTRSFRPDRMEKSAYLCRYIERRLEALGVEYASYVAMGAMLVYMRTHHRHIFDSPMSLKEKRKLFYEVNGHELVRRIAREYRFPASGVKQKIVFSLRRSYFSVLLFTRLNDFLKSLRGN